jgi:putative hydrolase of the HAD superfamily
MSGPRAILLDALGTLLELEPPAPRLCRELAERFGLRIGRGAAQRAIGAEIAYYRAHHREGCDARSLGDLRVRCTEVLREGLGEAAAGFPAVELQEALLASLRFRPFPEVPGALPALRSAGRRLVVVSNWDCSLREVLARAGLAEGFDGVVTSAEVGAAKPSPAIFVGALAVAGVAPRDAVHVGDSVREDVGGARAAAIDPILIRRGRRRSPPAGSPPGVRTIASLAELVDAAP